MSVYTAKVFEDGEVQTVRLPEEYRFDSEEVSVQKMGDLVILIPKSSDWSCFEKALDLFTDDFMKHGRAEQMVPERRI